MPRPDLYAEAQEYLLNLGDPDYFDTALPDVLRLLGHALPVFVEHATYPHTWVYGQLSATQVFTDATGAAQDVTLNDVLLSGTDQHSGHLIGAKGMFETVVYTMATAAGGTPAYQYFSWNGDLWEEIVPTSLPNFASTALQTLAFVAPLSWRRGIPPDVTFPDGFDADQYWLMVRALEPPVVTAPTASRLLVRLVSWPVSDDIQELVLALFYPRELHVEPVAAALDLYIPDWRIRTGGPTHLLRELSPLQMLRIYPIPDTLSTDTDPFFRWAADAAPGSNNLTVMYTSSLLEWRLPTWLEGLVVWRLAARDAMRQGERQDMPLAQALNTVADGAELILRNLWRDGLELQELGGQFDAAPLR